MTPRRGVVEQGIANNERAAGRGVRADPAHDTSFRSVCQKLNYLSADRPDIGYATKELCRHAAAPTLEAWAKAKRLCPYLVAAPAAQWVCPFGDIDLSRIEARADADFAGRDDSRNSSGFVLAFPGFSGGLCAVKASSATQSTVALSVAESELMALTRGACEALGLQTLCREFGLLPEAPAVMIRTDSTAAEGVIGRRGIGRLRHLRVRDLWLQGAVAARRLCVGRVPSEENVADGLTKYTPRRRHEELGRAMGVELQMHDGGIAGGAAAENGGTGVAAENGCAD